MTESKLSKITYIVNTALFIFVIGLMLSFYMAKAWIMVYFSIPTVMVYAIGYVLIKADHLYAYVLMVYFWIILYMTIATVCMGNNYGFQLYCMSLIPIAYVIRYFTFKLERKPVNANIISFFIVAAFLVSTLCVIKNGAIYSEKRDYALIFWICNSGSVFFFLIYYTKALVSIIINSEKQLLNIAHVDRLTGLYNRRYMMEVLEKIDKEYKTPYLAILDIDDFKKVNDHYGHNAGDYVLEKLSNIMKNVIKDDVICRWGGEEFLIYGDDSREAYDKLENLRKTICETRFEFEDQIIDISVTIGMSIRTRDMSTDIWIKTADEKLYEGKNSGKNKVLA
ncbi:MAG: GGDEF domain-containing protein [Lachnospiraceae bacterium]|nr:GGDEF domain-containing protein [Lachnospiraceae bacterium]